MILPRFSRLLAPVALAGLALAKPGAAAVTGLVGNGTFLFKFDVDGLHLSPPVTGIGNLGFEPEAMDFRPLAPGESDPVLYGIDVGTTTTQLYTINKTTAAATPVGAGFPTTVAGSYSLAGPDNPIGFDFDPRSLQADNSMRIRMVASNGSNLLLNSNTGAVAAVDTMLAFIAAPGATPFVGAVAYTNNNVATSAAAGTAALYAMDLGTDHLYLQDPPSNGSLNDVGAFGVDFNDRSAPGFDVYTDPLSVDDTVGGDRGLVVFLDQENLAFPYLYEVNLTTGAITNGLGFLPGTAFAVMPGVVPEPTTCGLLMVGAGLAFGVRRRRNEKPCGCLNQ